MTFSARSIFVAAALLTAPLAAAGTATAASYDGLWSVLIITQAGSCDAAYSYPFKVAGGRISSRRRRRPGADFGRRFRGQWKRLARRRLRLGPVDGEIVRRQLQRPLAGDAELNCVFVRRMAQPRPFMAVAMTGERT
jgi:hypothetical protein